MAARAAFRPLQRYEGRAGGRRRYRLLLHHAMGHCFSRVTDAVLDEVREWQSRALERMYPIVIFDALRVKIRDADSRIAIESLNRVIRKSIKTRGSFPTEDAATKLIYLAIRNFEEGGRNVREWFAARNQFAIMFGERFNA